MKKHMKQIAAAALLAACIFAQFPASAADVQTVSTSLEVRESEVIRKSDKRILGLHDGERFPASADSLAENTYYYNALRTYGISIPLIRTHYRDSNWKEYIGTIDERGYGELSDRYASGPVEWAKMYMSADPSAEFVCVINNEDSAENLKDFVRFMTLMPGDENACDENGVNWAAKRVESGIANPIPMACFEIGNEYDMGFATDSETIKSGAEKYIEQCNAIIDGLKEVNPDIKTSVMAYTTPHDNKGLKNIWNENVIGALGEKADYIVLHYYYHSSGNNGYDYIRSHINDDLMTYINRIPQENRPKIYISEHAVYANPDVAKTDEKATVTGLGGTLTTAEFINMTCGLTDVEMASYHAVLGSISTDDVWGGSCWGMLRPYTDGTIVLSCAGEYYRAAADAFGKNIVKSTLSGNSYCVPGTMWNNSDKKILTVSAHTAENGGLNLIAVNTSGEITHDVSFSAEGSYRLAKKVVLSGENRLDENYSSSPDRIYAKETLETDAAEFTGFSAEPMSVTVLYLVPSGSAAEDSCGEIKLVNADENGCVKGGTVKISCTLYDNRAAAQSKNLACLVLRGDADISDIKQSDIVYMSQSAVTRQRAYIDIEMPEHAESGSYKIYINSGAGATVRDFAYSAPEDSALAVLSVNAENAAYKAETYIYTDRKIPAGTAVDIEVKNLKSGELAARLQTEKTTNVQKVEIPMPVSAVSGRYTVSVQTAADGGHGAAAEFDFVKPGERVRISAPQNAAGKVYTLEDEKNNENMVLELRNLTDSPAEATVIAAYYNADGIMTDAAVSETAHLAAGGSTKATVKPAAVKREDTSIIRLYLWQDGTMLPLTDYYIVKGAKK